MFINNMYFAQPSSQDIRHINKFNSIKIMWWQSLYYYTVSQKNSIFKQFFTIRFSQNVLYTAIHEYVYVNTIYEYNLKKIKTDIFLQYRSRAKYWLIIVFHFYYIVTVKMIFNQEFMIFRKLGWSLLNTGGGLFGW